jgi:hypothetical protein
MRQEDSVSTQFSHHIAERAYHIWERLGRPEGQALEHWLLAEAELASSAVSPTLHTAETAPPAAKRSRRKKAA